MLTWAAEESGFLDHGEREDVIGQEGRELQRRLLQATFDLDSAREERIAQVASAAGVRHGTVEAGHGRGLASVFGPVRVTRMAYRNRREPNLYPADARQVLPDDPYSLGMRALTAYHLATGGYGQAQEIIGVRTGVAAPSSPGSRETSLPGPGTSTRSTPVTRKKRSSRPATRS